MRERRRAAAEIPANGKLLKDNRIIIVSVSVSVSVSASAEAYFDSGP